MHSLATGSLSQRCINITPHAFIGDQLAQAEMQEYHTACIHWQPAHSARDARISHRMHSLATGSLSQRCKNITPHHSLATGSLSQRCMNITPRAFIGDRLTRPEIHHIACIHWRPAHSARDASISHRMHSLATTQHEMNATLLWPFCRHCLAEKLDEGERMTGLYGNRRS